MVLSELGIIKIDKKLDYYNIEVTGVNSQLNLSTHELWCQEKKVQLGLKEFNILSCLMNHGNQIVTKELLIEKVWGYDADVDYNNVEVYISFLRKKLQFIKSSVCIKTVRGVGYCLGVTTND